MITSNYGSDNIAKPALDRSKRSADLRGVGSAAFRTRQRSPGRFFVASAPRRR
jgi:hypothetical protein